MLRIFHAVRDQALAGPLTRAFASNISRFMLQTTRGPLGAVWAAAHRIVMRGVAVYIRRRHRDAAVYVKGTFASGEAVHGISDIDVIVVAPGERGFPGKARSAIRERWRRLCRGVPLLGVLLRHFWVYEEEDLRESASAPCLLYGGAAFLGARPLADPMGLLDRPGLYGARREWRRLSGPERRPPEPPDDPGRRRVAGWLELQHWWRYAFLACAEPDLRHVPWLCVKLLAEPVRIWSWVERGEVIGTREEALRRGLREHAEEEAAMRLGLDLLRALPRSPAPPLAEVVPAFARLSRKLARRLAAVADAAGGTDVRLLWGGERELAVEPRAHPSWARGGSTLLPLADWRARAVPGLPDETFTLIGGEATDVALLAALARAEDAATVPALLWGGLLVLPTTDRERGVLRAVQCAATDPVSLALAAGRTSARFPDLSGWSARDSARRAVAEHAAWLAGSGVMTPPHGWVGPQPDSRSGTARALGLLFTATRAALFLESLEEGGPELVLTAAALVEPLCARRTDARGVVEEAVGALLECRRGEGDLRRGGVPSRELVTRFGDLVRALPAYAPERSFSGVSS